MDHQIHHLQLKSGSMIINSTNKHHIQFLKQKNEIETYSHIKCKKAPT